MKILITGTAGFIGYSFTKYLLLNTNHKIIGIDNLNDYYSKKIKLARIKNLKKNKNYKFYRLDISNKNYLKKIFKNNFKAVFHFAAQAGVRYSLINPRSYIDSNLNGFYNLIELVKKNNISKFFYASSSSVYGESTKFPLSEKSSIKPKNIYGLTKKINEELVELYFENSKTICVGLRFFTVFGEWGRPDMLIYKYLASIYDNKKKFYLNNYGNHTRDFTYIKDVVEILFKLFTKKLNKKNLVVNICSNKPIKITKVIKIINKNFKYKPKIFKRSFQKADVKKTHGNNTLIKKISMKNNFSSITKALNNTTKWYQEYWKLFT